MSVEAAITAYLETFEADVTPGWLPASPADPSVTYNEVDEDQTRPISGGVPVSSTAFFDVHIWSAKYTTAKALARSIRTGFNSLSAPVSDWHGISLYSARTTSLQDQPREADTSLYHVVLSVTLNIKET